MPGLFKFAVVFALATSGALAAAPRQIDVSEGPMAAAINSQLTEASETGFGGAVVVEVDGKTLLQAGYSYADREKKHRNSDGATA